MKPANQHEFWSRVFTFIPTPTREDGERFDEDALRRVLDHQIDNGVNGVCVFGSTGGNDLRTGYLSPFPLWAAKAWSILLHSDEKRPAAASAGHAQQAASANLRWLCSQPRS